MPVHKAKKNVNKRGLSPEERLDFESVGYSEKETNEFETKLKADRWLFWSRPSDLYITLKGVTALVMTSSGQPQMKEESLGLKFERNYATTVDRETALLVFLSDAYRTGKIQLASEKLEREKEKKVTDLKDAVMRDKDLLDRIKRELLGKEASA